MAEPVIDDFEVKIKLAREDAIIPTRATKHSVGFDIYANREIGWDKETRRELPLNLYPNQSILIGPGIILEVPFPYYTLIRGRSSFSLKLDIRLVDDSRTIDPDFRGEPIIKLRNKSKELFVIEKNMRIGQIIFHKARIPSLRIVEELSETERGQGGIGSTGV